MRRVSNHGFARREKDQKLQKPLIHRRIFVLKAAAPSPKHILQTRDFFEQIETL